MLVLISPVVSIWDAAIDQEANQHEEHRCGCDPSAFHGEINP